MVEWSAERAEKERGNDEGRGSSVCRVLGGWRGDGGGHQAGE